MRSPESTNSPSPRQKVRAAEDAWNSRDPEKVALAPDPIHAEELPQGLAPTEQGWLRTDPAMLGEAGGLDGFFVARFRG